MLTAVVMALAAIGLGHTAYNENFPVWLVMAGITGVLTGTGISRKFYKAPPEP